MLTGLFWKNGTGLHYDLNSAVVNKRQINVYFLSIEVGRISTPNWNNTPQNPLFLLFKQFFFCANVHAVEN